MSRFFFHLRGGGGIRVEDPVGTECRDADEARCFAVQLADDLAGRDETARLYPPCAYLDVEDEAQRPLFMLPLRVGVSEK